jgi:signal transduction histidine kinase
MKKVAAIFLLAVLLPSLGLAWLAVRSLRDQDLILERQQTLLYQGVADAVSRELNDYLSELQRSFLLEVERLLVKEEPRAAAADFDERLRQSWALADVGFVVALDGAVLAPTQMDRAENRKFRFDNDLFLTGRESAAVYALNPQNWIAQTLAPTEPVPNQAGTDNRLPPSPPQLAPTRYGQKNPREQRLLRNVDPVQAPAQQAAEANLSRIVFAETDFQALVGEAREGALARFLQNKLNLMFWYRPARDPQLVFGARIDLTRLVDELSPWLQRETASWAPEICVALLDDTTRPVALTHLGFTATWKRPFVAAEVGEILPHWEVAVYLLDPAGLSRAAHTIKLTLGLLIALLLVAIGTGSWLVIRDLRRQLTLARQKTDFVSNVSHELKTPLTSIRMFAELLAEERVTERDKQRRYLDIITAETARLTRLINNVLDFARLEHGEKKYRFEDCDLATVVRDTAEAYRPHLESAGFGLAVATAPAPLPVRADRDALAQVLTNLLSNAEKYSGDSRELSLEVWREERPLPYAEVRVLDRGLGVPHGCAEKIFEQFYRAHDCLDSGIQGSGLGLTLARQIARAHGGDVAYTPRDGGGSCFALRLPLRPEPTTRSARPGPAADASADSP